MTALRRHVLAAVAALFALAVGIALGGGPLSYVEDAGTGPVTDASPGSDPSGSPSGSATPDPDFTDEFADTVASTTYDAALLGHPSAVVAMPGASGELVDQMVDEVRRAGGGLTGVFRLGDEATAVSGTSLVDTLGSQLMTELDDDRVDPAASTYVRFGQLLGVAIATLVKEGGLRATDDARTIREAFATAGLMTSDEEARLAPLVLVVMPSADAVDPDDLLAATSIHAGLLVGLAGNAVGTVAIGDSASALEDGLLGALRAESTVTDAVSTVDGVESEVGRVVAMLALIASLSGSNGSYGASGAEGVPPVP